MIVILGSIVVLGAGIIIGVGLAAWAMGPYPPLPKRRRPY